MKVNFLIGGTEPAGTNQLFSLLKNHPDICLPLEPQPEPNFFSKHSEHSKGASYYHQKYFAHFGGEDRVGEKSGRYLWHPKAAERIRQYNYSMKLIFILRDPVDRAFSNYRFNTLNGIEPLDFRSALAQERRRCNEMSNVPAWSDIQPFAYFEKGLYARQLKRYVDVFGVKNICILHNEALRSDTIGQVEKVLEFLGLSSDTYEHLDDSPQYRSFRVRSRRLQTALRRLSRPLLERAIMSKRAKTRPSILEALVRLNFTDRRESPDPRVVDDLRRRYREEMTALAGLTPIRVVDWLEDRYPMELAASAVPG